MAVEELLVDSVTAYEDGRPFGPVGPYERLDGRARYAVDPDRRGNRDIVDLDLVDRDPDGLARFEGDVTILRPVGTGTGIRCTLLEIPNRGRRTLTTLFNQAVTEIPPGWPIPAGDGFLMERGFSLAWCGWQWDVPRGPGRMGLEAPRVEGAEPGWTQLRFQLPADAATVSLTDQHVGPLGAHEPIPTVDIADPDAVLHVRARLDDEPAVVPRSRWRFVDPVTLEVDGGLVAGRIYDLVYRVGVQPVVGAGLLAVRDLAAFLRSGRADNPVAARADRLIVTGLSQNSRLLRHLLHLGFDRDESDQAAFDGALGVVGGARRGEFNHRFAQPSVQPTPSFGHLFPFADLIQEDPRTAANDGLLALQVDRPEPPRVVFADTSAEYWRGDASLAHTSVIDGSDVAAPSFVRRYLFTGAQHSTGPAVLGTETIQGTRGANQLNLIDYRPLYRCTLMNLVAWITDGTDPPPSAVPRLDDGTASTRDEVIGSLAAIPLIVTPEPDQLPVLRPLDLGPGAGRGVGRYPARPFGEPYPCVVSAVDADGNEVAGIAMPDVTVPVATHLGFNPRHPTTGAPAQIMEYYGSSVPFARTAAERATTGDPRLSIEERYADLDVYLDLVRAAAVQLVARRHLLAEDVELCVELARTRYLLFHPAPRRPVSPASP